MGGNYYNFFLEQYESNKTCIQKIKTKDIVFQLLKLNNYLHSQVLGKKGHSYEVDVWSLGCILYTLLVGKPPFETQSLKDTYNRIKMNEYYVPSKEHTIIVNFCNYCLPIYLFNQGMLGGTFLYKLSLSGLSFYLEEPQLVAIDVYEV